MFNKIKNKFLNLDLNRAEILLLSIVITLGTKFIFKLAAKFKLSFNPNTTVIGYPLKYDFNVDVYYKRCFLGIIYALIFSSLILYIVRKTNIIDYGKYIFSRVFNYNLAELFKNNNNFEIGMITATYSYFLLQTSFPLAILFFLIPFSIQYINDNTKFQNMASLKVFYFLLAITPTLLIYKLIPLLSFTLKTSEYTLEKSLFPQFYAIISMATSILVITYFCFRRNLFENTLKNTFYYMFVPLLVFFYYSHIPQAISNSSGVDFFHLGESLTPGLQIYKGALPYKDTLFIHGLLKDPLGSILGFKLFHDSIWGHIAFYNSLLLPISKVFFYLLLFFLIPKPVAFLYSMLLIFGSPQVFPGLRAIQIGMYRYEDLFLYLVFILFFIHLKKENFISLFMSITIAIFSFFMITDTAFLMPAIALTLFLKDYGMNNHKKRFFEKYKLTIYGASTFIFWILMISLTLWHFGVLRSFFDYYSNLSGGLQYAGGLPFTHFGMPAVFGVVFPPLLVVFALFIFANKEIDKKTKYFILFSVIYTMLFYRKGIYRTHIHLYRQIAIPLMMMAFIFTKLVVKNFFQARLTQIIICLVTIVYFAPNINEVKKKTNRSKVVVIGKEVPNPVKNFSPFFNITGKVKNKIVNLKSFFNQVLPPDEKIFDFTNSPLMFYYALELPMATAFPHVSLSLSSKIQTQLVNELKRDDPPLVIAQIRYSDSVTGLGDWDSVSVHSRHYFISSYINLYYRPYVLIDDYYIYVKKNLYDQYSDKLNKLSNVNWESLDESTIKRKEDRKNLEHLPLHMANSKSFKKFFKKNCHENKVDLSSFIKVVSSGNYKIDFTKLIESGQRVDSILLTALNKGGQLQIKWEDDEVLTTFQLSSKHKQYRLLMASNPQWTSAKHKTVSIIGNENFNLNAIDTCSLTI